MIEVFRTNITDPVDALIVVHRIHEEFSDHQANFDLEDCDRILRVMSRSGSIHSSRLIAILNDFGYDAEILPG